MKGGCSLSPMHQKLMKERMEMEQKKKLLRSEQNLALAKTLAKTNLPLDIIKQISDQKIQIDPGVIKRRSKE